MNVPFSQGNYDGGEDTCEGDSGGGLYIFDKNARNSTFRVLSGITRYVNIYF